MFRSTRAASAKRDSPGDDQQPPLLTVRGWGLAAAEGGTLVLKKFSLIVSEAGVYAPSRISYCVSASGLGPVTPRQWAISLPWRRSRRFIVQLFSFFHQSSRAIPARTLRAPHNVTPMTPGARLERSLQRPSGRNDGHRRLHLFTAQRRRPWRLFCCCSVLFCWCTARLNRDGAEVHKFGDYTECIVLEDDMFERASCRSMFRRFPQIR